MASLDTGSEGGAHKKGPGVKKAKRMSTHVDMTPMVDLGFLLITFFIFTATMSEPTAMDLNVPKDDIEKKDETEVKQSGALTILLSKNDNVYYYEGQLQPDASNFKSTNFKGIRDVIIKKRNEVISRYVPDPKCEEKAKQEGKPEGYCKDQDLTVVIKPNDESTYKNAVDILDEMTINGVKRYALVKISDEEQKLVNATEGGGAAPAPAQ